MTQFHYSLNRYIDKSWLMFFRRLYLSYCIFLAFLYLLIEGFSFGTQLFYSFKHAETDEMSFQLLGRGKVIQICVAGIIVVGSMMLATLLSKGVEFLFLVWKKEHYSEISRRVLSFLSLNSEHPRFQIVDLFIQLAIVMYLEVLPLVCAFVVLIVNLRTDLTFGLNCLFSFGSLFALSIILTWWFFSIVANYKRLFIFCLRKGKRFYRRVDRIGQVPNSRRKKIFLPQDIIIDAEENEIVPIAQADYFSHKQAVQAVLRKQRDLFVMLYIHLWWKRLCSIPIPFNFVRRIMVSNHPAITIRPKQIWLSMLAGFLVLLVLSTTLFNAWKIFSVSSVAVACCIVDFIINRVVFIPPHNPNRQRLRATWALEGHFFLLHRFCAVFEDVYFLSPEIVFGVSKMGVYAHTLLITVCLLFKFYNGFSVFILPLICCIYVCFIYALRFNCGRVINAVKRIHRSIGSSDISEWWTSASVINVLSPTEESALLGKDTPDTPDTPILTDEAKDTPPVPNAAQKRLSQSRSRSSSTARSHLTRIFAPSLMDDNTSEGTDSEIDTSLKKHLHVHHEVEFLRILSVFSVVFLITFGSTVLFILNLVALGVIPALIFLLALASVSFIIFKRYEKNTAPIWNGFFYIFVIFIGILFIMGSIEQEPTYEGTSARVGKYIDQEYPGYAICTAKWHGYNILDYALFAYLSYEHEPYAREDFEVWFPEIANSTYDLSFHQSSGGMVFFDLYIPEKNLSVVSVRGTATFLDMIQDIYLWKEVVFLQIASVFGPFANFWPISLSVEIVNGIAAVERFMFERYAYDEASYYNFLDDYLNKITKTRNAILVGHSLGGGVAKICAAKHSLQVVTFSAPGVVLISKRVGITLERINRISMNVKPYNDIVTSIDSYGGLSQEIDCPYNFLECHRLINTVNTLIDSCGNMPLGRYISPSPTKPDL